MAAARAFTRLLLPAVCGMAVGAVAAFALHDAKPARMPMMPRPEPRIATVVTPEGGGACRRIMLSNDAPLLIADQTVACEALRPKRADLPPVLKGYQASLRD